MVLFREFGPTSIVRSHLEFGKVKMNVRLATQTLGNSTAASIEYLNTVMNNERFRDSEPTVEYFRVWNNMFDIINTKINHCGDKYKYKKPISETNIDEISSYFEYAKKYIKGLHIVEYGKKKPILKSRSFTPFFGFYNNMTSFTGIHHDYVNSSPANEFYTFDVSQDHLKSYFGCVRRMGGNVLIRFDYRDCNKNNMQ